MQGGNTATKFPCHILPNRIYTQANKNNNKKTGLQSLKSVKFAFNVLQGADTFSVWDKSLRLFAVNRAPHVIPNQALNPEFQKKPLYWEFQGAFTSTV